MPRVKKDKTTKTETSEIRGVVRGWLTKLDGYGNVVCDSEYIEFIVPKGCQAIGSLRTFFFENYASKLCKTEKSLSVEMDDFCGKDMLFNIAVKGYEDFYYCFETNEYISMAKKSRGDICATPFACVG